MACGHGPPPLQSPSMPLRERARWVADHLIPGGKLLDVGCYDAASTVEWLRSAEAVFGIDTHQAVLGGNPKVRRAMASAAALPFTTASFDTVVCSEVLEHLPFELERPTIEEIHRVLSPGGRLLLTTPHSGAFAWLDPMDVKRRLGLRPGKGHKHYSVQEIEILFSGLFVIDTLDLNSLILHPLSTGLGVGNLNRLKRIREALSDWDYQHHFGRASFNMALVASSI